MAASGRSATERRRRPVGQTRLHLRLFCHFERIVDFDAQVRHRAFQPTVPEQELDVPKILCSSIRETLVRRSVCVP